MNLHVGNAHVHVRILYFIYLCSCDLFNNPFSNIIWRLSIRLVNSELEIIREEVVVGLFLHFP
jgi:hypothetical protein